MTTELHNAIKAAGISSLTFNISSRDITIPIDDLSTTALLGLLTYGRRKANDAYNSAKTGDNPLSVDQTIDKVKTWDFGAREGISPIKRELRLIVKALLIEQGMKPGEAAKEVKTPIDGFAYYIGKALAAKQGRPFEQITREEIAPIVESQWGKIQARAEKNLAQSQVSIDIEI